MPDTLTMTGTLQTAPTDPSASGLTAVVSAIAEALVLQTKGIPGEYDLQSDSPQSVSFGALPQVNVLQVKVYGGGPVTVSVTSSAGTTQAWPVDSFLFLITQRVNITAITLTRSPGVETWVDVFIGQAAS
jgi:hypothetical protein